MFQKMRARAGNVFNAVKDKATGVFVVGSASLLPGLAMAQTADFDPTTVTAKITEYVGFGIIMLAAYILGKWTLKALGVIGGK